MKRFIVSQARWPGTWQGNKKRTGGRKAQRGRREKGWTGLRIPFFHYTFPDTHEFTVLRKSDVFQIDISKSNKYYINTFFKWKRKTRGASIGGGGETDSLFV